MDKVKILKGFASTIVVLKINNSTLRPNFVFVLKATYPNTFNLNTSNVAKSTIQKMALKPCKQ
jgi:hypothetical protein